MCATGGQCAAADGICSPEDSGVRRSSGGERPDRHKGRREEGRKDTAEQQKQTDTCTWIVGQSTQQQAPSCPGFDILTPYIYSIPHIDRCGLQKRMSNLHMPQRQFRSLPYARVHLRLPIPRRPTTPASTTNQRRKETEKKKEQSDILRVCLHHHHHKPFFTTPPCPAQSLPPLLLLLR